MKTNTPVANAEPHREETYDEWFRSQVQKTHDGIADGSVKLVSESEHDRRWREGRAALLATPIKSA